MNNKIKQIEIEGEKIYMKKSGWFGWNVVYPNTTEGRINWKNLIAGGNWFNLVITLFIVLIILGCVYEYTQALTIANECLNKTITIEVLPKISLP